MAVEKKLSPNEFIVSKTDAKGIITYANEVFLRIAEYEEGEVIGKPHNFIRHPQMPKCVFKLMWEQLKAGKEIFAYVINSTKHKDYYWVHAHVTPTFDNDGRIIGYHSNRRAPRDEALKIIKPLYQHLLEAEKKHSNPNQGMQASYDILQAVLQEKGMSYDEFIFSF